MDYAGLTRLLIRIAGVLSIAHAIGSIPLLFFGSVLYIGLSLLLLPLVIGCLLFFCAGPITNRIFDAPVAAHTLPDVGKVEGAALFVLGCYLLALAIVGVIHNAAHLLFVWRLTPPLDARNAIADYAGLSTNIAEGLIAVILIFGARGIVVLKDRLLGSSSG